MNSKSRTEVVAEGIIWKEILKPGFSRISQKPIEGSKCVVKIENIKLESAEEETGNDSLTAILSEQNSNILTGETNVSLVIGEADSEIDNRIERAIQLMKDSEQARITILIQDPNTNLKPEKILFDATLLKHERFKPIWEWTPEEKYDISMKYKNIGVKLFKQSELQTNRFRDAFYRFSKACKILITLEPIDDLELDETLYNNIKILRMKLYNNMAACQAKFHNYYHVIELCSKVLAIDDNDVLALFRRGYAYGELKDYERAVQDFTRLLSVAPSDKQALEKFRHYNLCLKRANMHCNEMVKRMFKT